MKKLLLLSALLIFACSSDDSIGGDQLFLEKYDSVVWEKLPLDEDFRIAFINSSNSVTQYSSQYGCLNRPIEGTDGITTTAIQQETENSLSLLVQIESDFFPESYITVFTVTSDGSTYIITQTYDGVDFEDEVYTRTEYDVCF